VEVEIDAKKPGHGKTVLVIDDNAAIRKMIASAFLSDGFKTCGEAENGKEGIELAKNIHPDLITVDLSMPVMNGLEAAAELRKLLPDTPIILFTLFGDGLPEKEAHKSGVDLILSKTTPLPHVITLAHRLLGAKHMNRFAANQ
jgi:two-component system chemotaxis response regulator CheY